MKTPKSPTAESQSGDVWFEPRYSVSQTVDVYQTEAEYKASRILKLDGTPARYIKTGMDSIGFVKFDQEGSECPKL